MPDVGLTHVALTVTDLAASIDFYARYAGLEVVHQREGVVWLSDHTRPFVVVLAEEARVDHPLRPFGHLGTACASRDEVDRLCALARAEGRLLTAPRIRARPPVIGRSSATPTATPSRCRSGKKSG